jgi:hypothetical protein
MTCVTRALLRISMPDFLILFFLCVPLFSSVVEGVGLVMKVTARLRSRGLS